jgi:hypothetical protein
VVPPSYLDGVSVFMGSVGEYIEMVKLKNQRRGASGRQETNKLPASNLEPTRVCSLHRRMWIEPMDLWILLGQPLRPGHDG